MEPTNAIDCPHKLKLHTPGRRFTGEPEQPPTPNSWWVARYPDAYANHGSPFLELTEQSGSIIAQVLPVTQNLDFFGAALGGRRELGHHVIYFEPEMQWYFRDSDGIYKTTSAEKLMTQYRALMMLCAQEMPATVHRLNLVHEWRSDRVCKAIVQRAKSMLAADQSYFSSTSNHQRVKGPELFERLMRVLCETMLQPSNDDCLTVSQAYRAFCRLAEQRQLGTLKRSQFKATMQDLMKDRFGVGLRRDVPDALGKQQEAWRGVKLVDTETLAA